jgi:hypothetical protein
MDPLTQARLGVVLAALLGSSSGAFTKVPRENTGLGRNETDRASAEPVVGLPCLSCDGDADVVDAGRRYVHRWGAAMAILADAERGDIVPVEPGVKDREIRMTRAEWMACADPHLMLSFVSKKVAGSPSRANM